MAAEGVLMEAGLEGMKEWEEDEDHPRLFGEGSRWWVVRQDQEKALSCNVFETNVADSVQH